MYYLICYKSKYKMIGVLPILSILAVHRPFYISICIATLPTQHTTFILLVAVCILHPLTELFFACTLWIAHRHIIYTPGYLLKGQTAVHTWDWMSPLFLKDRDVEQYQCLPENQKYCTLSNNSNIVPSSLNAFEDWHKNIIKSHFFPTSL